jgi:S-DNA-T family DNA segregation ATPase FtsK/SpoIIIE
MQAKMNAILNELSIAATCVRAERHRHLAFFDIKVANQKGALERLKRSSEAIALALKPETVPVISLVPKDGVVRMHMAMGPAESINLVDLYGGEEIDIEKKVFPLLLGENAEGHKLWTDMNNSPHMLVAGATNSGKSTVLHTLIGNALNLHALGCRRMCIHLVDPKQVEFQRYNDECLNGVVKNIVTEYTDTVSMFEGLVQQMDRRYEKLRDLGLQSIAEKPWIIPLITCVVDEVSSLILQDKSGKLQGLFIQIAQKGRAAGIFLTLATQRPTTDVITGSLKANFPGRIACKVSQRQDSLVILDDIGAETLLGKGDSILKDDKHSKVRFQAAYTTPQKNIDTFKFYNSLKG